MTRERGESRDGAVIQPPREGGERTGKNPTDGGKLGGKTNHSDK